MFLIIFFLLTISLSKVVRKKGYHHCPRNQVYSCGCENTCSNPTRICHAACIHWRCICKPGYLKNSKGVCVKPQHCRCEKGCAFWHTTNRECRCRYGKLIHCKKTIRSPSHPQCTQCKKGQRCSYRRRNLRELKIYERRWRRFNPRRYQYIIRHVGFNNSCYRERVIVYVVNNRVVRVRFVNRNRRTNSCYKNGRLTKTGKWALDLKNYMTMTRWFSELKSLIHKYDRISISYNAKYGYVKNYVADPGHAKARDEYTKVFSCLSSRKMNDRAFNCDGTPLHPHDIDHPHYICHLPVKTGRCRAHLPRYYYDRRTKRCKRFIYGGCGGNENRFRTRESCQDECGHHHDFEHHHEHHHEHYHHHEHHHRETRSWGSETRDNENGDNENGDNETGNGDNENGDNEGPETL